MYLNIGVGVHLLLVYLSNPLQSDILHVFILQYSYLTSLEGVKERKKDRKKKRYTLQDDTLHHIT